MNEFWNSLCGYVQETCKTEVWKARRSFNPQSSKPFITVDLMFKEPGSKDLVVFDKETDTERVRNSSLVYFKIESFGESSQEKITKLRGSFLTSNFLYFCERNGAGLTSLGTIRNISSPFIDSAYEERCSITIGFYVTEPEEFSADSFNSEKIKFSKEKEDAGDVQVGPNNGGK